MHSGECMGMKPLSTAKARQRDVVVGHLLLLDREDNKCCLNTHQHYSSDDEDATDL